MRILLANWKVGGLLGPALMAVCAAFSLILLPSATDVGEWIAWLPVIACPFLSMSILDKVHAVAESQLSFCLPGFRESLRKTFFSTAVLLGLLFALLWFPVRAQFGVRSLCLYAVGSSLAGVTFSLCPRSRHFIAARTLRAHLPFIVIPLLLFGLICLCAANGHPLTAWLVVIPACIVICAFVWRRLGDMDRVMQGHRGTVDAARGDRTQVKMGRTITPSTERLFLQRMENCQHQGIGRHVWGGLYRVSGPVLTCWPWVWVPLLVIAFVSGCLDKIGILWVLLVLGYAWAIELPLRCDMFLPSSRRQRYWMSIVVAVVTSVCLIAATLIITAMTRFASSIMAHFFGWDFTGVSWMSAIFFCLLMPWVFALRVVNDRLRLRWKTVALMAAGLFLVVLLVRNRDEVLEMTVRLTWWMLLGVTLVGWAVFALILHRACTRWDLVKPRAGVRV